MFANPLEFDVVLRARSTHVNLVITAVRRGVGWRKQRVSFWKYTTAQFTTLPGATAGGTCTFQATPTLALFMFRCCCWSRCFFFYFFFYFFFFIVCLVVASVSVVALVTNKQRPQAGRK